MATPLDLPHLLLIALALSLAGGWVLWVALPTLADWLRGNLLVSIVVWSLVLAWAWTVLKPVIHTLTA